MLGLAMTRLHEPHLDALLLLFGTRDDAL